MMIPREIDDEFMGASIQDPQRQDFRAQHSHRVSSHEPKKSGKTVDRQHIRQHDVNNSKGLGSSGNAPRDLSRRCTSGPDRTCSSSLRMPRSSYNHTKKEVHSIRSIAYSYTQRSKNHEGRDNSTSPRVDVLLPYEMLIATRTKQ